MALKFAKSFAAFTLAASALLLGTAPAYAQDQDLSANYQWKPVRIGAGGFMRGMAVSPSNATKRYARGDVGEVYRWDDAAQQWFPTFTVTALPASLSSGGPVAAGGGAIAIDPQNPDHVMVVITIGSGLNVFTSTDGALHYTAGNLALTGSLTQESTGERLAIDPNNGQIAYLGPPGAQGTPDGLQRSLDGGATWTQVTGGGLPVSTSAVRYEFALPRFDGGSGAVSANGVTSTKIIYVSYIKHDETNSDAVLSGGVLRSADGGVTWTDVSDPNVAAGSTVAFATMDSAGNLWISDGSANLFKYSRAGIWTTSSSANLHGGSAGIAIDLHNPLRIFASSGDNMSRSLDGGLTWTNLESNLTYSTTQPIEWLRPSPARPASHGVSVAGLYIDPAGNLWQPTGNDGILTTLPNDTTDSPSDPQVWTSSSVGIEEMVAEPEVIPPGGQPVLTEEDETLFTISDPDTFTAQHFPGLWDNGNNGLADATDITYIPNQPKFLAVASSNLTASGGTYSSGSNPCNTYGEGGPLSIGTNFGSYSTDGGDTWTKFPSILNGTHPNVLYGGSIAVSPRASGHESDPAGADNLVWIPTNWGDFSHFGEGPAPFYSKDGGATWTQTQSFNSVPGAQQLTECFSSTAWTYMPFQWGPWIFTLSQHLLVADPVTPGTFYVDMVVGGMWKSTDGGVTWTQLPGTGGPTLPHHGTLATVPGVSGDMWIADGQDDGGNRGLFHTVDGGNSFTRDGHFDYAYALALGKAASGQTYPAIYVYGKYTGDANWGIFQSIDGGNTYNRVSYYPGGIIDVPNFLTASWDVFGTVYLAFSGNSNYYGSYYAPNILPGAPVLSGTPADGEVNLSWQIASNSGTPSSFNVYRGTTSGGESATPIATGITSNNYTDTGLTDGQTYYYTVAGINGIGLGPQSNEVAVAPAVQPPTAPTGVATFPGDGQVLVSWTAVSKATSYKVFRGNNSGGEGTTPIATTSTASYLDTGLVNGNVYYYTVEAVNSAGASPSSSEAQGKPAGFTSTTAQIARAATAPALDGSVSPVWNTTATYALGNLVGTIPSGQSNSASWQGLWDSNNLYVLVNVLDSVVVPNSDSVEVYIDGNDGKATSYTSLDWQYIFQYGTPQVQQYSGGTLGTNTAGVIYSQAAITGGYRIVAQIPWSTLGVSPAQHDLIGIDVAINNFHVAGTRTNKLFWNSTTDLDYTNPSLFGTAELLPGVATPQAAAPIFTPVAGTYTSAQSVTLTSATAGASIYYTTDGSTPSSTHGTLYAGPISVGATAQINAVATLAGDLNSVVASASYVINIPVQTAAPDISPASGSYSSAVNVTLSTTTAGASIRYTTDGSIPSETVGTVYAGPVTVSSSLTLRAIAYVSGDLDSSVVSASYVIGNSSSLPTGWTDLDIGSPSLAGSGTHKNGVWSITGSGADIYGTADQFNFASKAVSGDASLSARVTAITNTDPWSKAGVSLRGSTAAGAVYAAVLVTPSNGIVFQWRGAADGETNYIQVSGIASPTLENPVWLKVTKSGAAYTGYYSRDGKTYVQVGTPVVIAFPAAAFYAGLAVTSHNPTALNTADFTNVSLHSGPSKVAKPTFAPGAGSFDSPQAVTIASTTAGALIRYTIDGSLPSTTNGTLYTTPVTVGSDLVLRAVAYLPGETTSAVACARFSFQLPSGWSEEDIGLPAVDGSASKADGVWTVSAAGDDIYGTSDQFGFPDTTIAGDSSISAKLTSFSGSNAWAKGGLMYRDSSDPTAINVAVLATAENGIVVQWRGATAGSTAYAQLLGVPAPTPAKPLWLKLSRSGSTFTAYYSINGKSYDQVGPSVSVSFTNNPALVGLAVTSHDVSSLSTVTYKDVTLTKVETQVATPSFSPAAGLYTQPQTVTIGTATPNATIRYTLDGTTPSTTTGTVYSGPITLAANVTVNAIAYETGDVQSAVATAAYTIVVNTLANGLYTIVNRNADKDLNDYGFGASGGQLHIYDLSATQNTEFTATQQPDGYYTFTELYTSVNIGAAGSATSGSPVDVETATSASTQEWLLEPTDSGYYTLVNKLSGLVLDVSGGSTALGSAVVQDTDTGATSQQWQFVPEL